MYGGLLIIIHNYFENTISIWGLNFILVYKLKKIFIKCTVCKDIFSIHSMVKDTEINLN